MDKKKVMEYLNSLMVVYIQENLKIILLMEEVILNGLMVDNMMENGYKIKCLDKEN